MLMKLTPGLFYTIYSKFLLAITFHIFLQTVMGIVISAMTGSEDPAEVSQMAKQASEVIKD